MLYETHTGYYIVYIYCRIWVSGCFYKYILIFSFSIPAIKNNLKLFLANYIETQCVDSVLMCLVFPRFFILFLLPACATFTLWYEINCVIARSHFNTIDDWVANERFFFYFFSIGGKNGDARGYNSVSIYVVWCLVFWGLKQRAHTHTRNNDIYFHERWQINERSEVVWDDDIGNTCG